jgi:hypothetical protein
MAIVIIFSICLAGFIYSALRRRRRSTGRTRSDYPRSVFRDGR